MAILIDSALVPEVKDCFENYPWVKGLSTNPKLMALASKEIPVKKVIKTLAGFTNGPFYYQLTSTEEKDLLKEIKAVQEIVGKRLIVKIMPTYSNFTFTHKYRTRYDFCFTAVHSLSQAALAHQAGAKHIAIYVNRMLKNKLKPYQLINDVCRLYPDNGLQILAASIKSTKEFETTLLAGAQNLTLPYSLFPKLALHKMSLMALVDFEKDGKGILN